MFITSSLISKHCNFSHGFFTRCGGVSRNKYESLNCAEYVGDDELCVSQNLKIVKRFLNCKELIVPRQFHSDVVEVVSYNDIGKILEADAVITTEKALAIGVLSADCLPVLCCLPDVCVIAAIHVGWRGAYNNIVFNVLNKIKQMCGKNVKILAALGPCIGFDSYEVDLMFVDNFTKKHKNLVDKSCCFKSYNGMAFFDLARYVACQLIECGLSEDSIDSLNIDTYANSEKFFSYRFSKKTSDQVCGRQISAICINE